jgi:hypothetical protein
LEVDAAAQPLGGDAPVVLERIEKLIEQLPYKTATVSIELKNRTIELNKEKKNKCGFGEH